MNDMRAVIIPKSDQLNADDLIGGPMTITIREVTIRPGTEQPVSVHFDGDNGKPWKPCKTMARVLVHCWGPDASKYTGRSLTLYCDPKVRWGGMEVGGIRISHMSDISTAHTLALTVTKGSKKLHSVQPLAVQKAEPAAAPMQQAAPKRTMAMLIDELEIEFAKAETRQDVLNVSNSARGSYAKDKATNGARERLLGIIDAAMKRTEPTQDEDAELAGGLKWEAEQLPDDHEKIAAFRKQHEPLLNRWKKERPELFKSVDDVLAEREYGLGGPEE